MLCASQIPIADLSILFCRADFTCQKKVSVKAANRKKNLR